MKKILLAGMIIASGLYASPAEKVTVDGMKISAPKGSSVKEVLVDGRELPMDKEKINDIGKFESSIKLVFAKDGKTTKTVKLEKREKMTFREAYNTWGEEDGYIIKRTEFPYGNCENGFRVRKNGKDVPVYVITYNPKKKIRVSVMVTDIQETLRAIAEVCK